MKQIVKKGATSNLFCIFIQDSSSTTGAGLTGLTSGSSGLVCYRARADDGNAGGTAISLSAGTKGTWSSGGFVEKDATNMPGVYELGVPDAVFATGSNYGIVMLKGATNMAPVVMEFELIGADLQDAVHLGLSSLPNTAVTTNASLLTSGTGTDQLSVTSGRIDVGKLLGTAWLTPGTAGTPDVNAKLIGGTAQTGRDIGASVLLSAGTGTGQLDFTSGVVKANATQWLGGTIPAVNVTGVPLVDLKYTLGTISPATAGSVRADSVTGAVGSVTSGVTVTTNNDKSGYGISAGAVSSIWQDTTASDFTTALSVGKSIMNGVSLGTGLTIAAVSGAVGSVTGAVGSVTAGVTVTTNNDKTGYSLLNPPGIRKNVALSHFEFLMTDSTNHNPLTGATVTVTRSVDGGAFGAGTLSAVTEIAFGIYAVNFGAADLNGSVVTLRATATGADDLDVTIVTCP